MAYEDKHGITDIKKQKFHNLSISLDYDYDPDDLHPVLLFTPDMSNTIEHWHISLDKKETKELYEWLGKYLKDHG